MQHLTNLQQKYVWRLLEIVVVKYISRKRDRTCDIQGVYIVLQKDRNNNLTKPHPLSDKRFGLKTVIVRNHVKSTESFEGNTRHQKSNKCINSESKK